MAKRKGIGAFTGIVILAIGSPWLAPPAHARSGDGTTDPYSIMVPERAAEPPGVVPLYRSPRGLPQRPSKPRLHHRRPPVARVAPRPAPPTILPNGRAVPNLPPVNQGAVPGGGRETFGDRAARCSHQGALFGVPANQQSTYMNLCAMGQ